MAKNIEYKPEKIILGENETTRIYLEIERNQVHTNLIEILEMKLDKINGKRDLQARINFDIKFLPRFLIELIKLLPMEE